MHKINMSVAMDENGGIAKCGVIPWHLSAEMEYFNKITIIGKNVVIGRKKWVSLPLESRPLPNRLNIILTRNKGFNVPHPQCLVLHSPDHVLQYLKDKKFYIIGGEEIYNVFFQYASRLVVTHVHTKIKDCDKFFPKINGEWRHRTLLEHEADEENQFPFTIIEYTRRPRFI